MNNSNNVYPTIYLPGMPNVPIPYDDRFIRYLLDIHKTQISENIKTAALQERETIREQMAERRKAQYEELVLTNLGTVQLVTRNLATLAPPREICNATNFSSTILMNALNPEESIIKITCNIDGAEKEIFVDSKKIGDERYLMQKYSSTGVLLKLPASKQKLYYRLLTVKLQEKPSDCIFLPHTYGWSKLPNEEQRFTYTKEGELTWNLALKKTI